MPAGVLYVPPSVPRSMGGGVVSRTFSTGTTLLEFAGGVGGACGTQSNAFRVSVGCSGLLGNPEIPTISSRLLISFALVGSLATSPGSGMTSPFRHSTAIDTAPAAVEVIEPTTCPRLLMALAEANHPPGGSASGVIM